MSVNFATLTGVLQLSDGDAVLLRTYQGIRFTVIPNASTVRYSKVDDSNLAPSPSNHDPATQQDVTVETTVDVDWPYYLVSVSGGSARVALV
jgi:hypothetical protein